MERFEPHGGGVEGAAWNVAHALAAEGMHVTVIARRAAPAPAPGAGIAVERVPVSDRWQPYRVLAFSRAAARAIADADRPFDVVHGFARTWPLDIYRTGGGSHAHYLARTYSRTGAALRRLSPRHRVQLDLERRIFRDQRTWIHCVSALVRHELVAKHAIDPERLYVIHNGVDHAHFDSSRHATAAAALRREYAGGAATGGATRWLFAGSGARRKGLETALRALAGSADTSAELWVAGRDAPGRWRKLARQLGIAERVRFLGPRTDMAVVHAAADGLILPTRYDPFANVCLEAAASGRPVITSAANGAAELLGAAGIVVERADDAPGFARALDAFADPHARLAAGERGRKLALGHGWDDHARALCSLYRRRMAASR